MKSEVSLKRNAFLNVIKQLCAVIFPLVSFPYAIRILETENYGIYSFSRSIVSYITLVAALGVSTYASREGAKKRENAFEIKSFADEVFTINIISTVFSYLALGILIIFWRKLDAYLPVIIILSCGVLFTTIGADWVNVVYEDYAYITKRYIVCNLVAIICLFLFVKSSGDLLIYAIDSIIANVLANIINLFYIRKKYGLHLRFVWRREILAHLKPILILFANSVTTVIYINSDVTILGVLRSDREVGIYGIATKVYELMKNVINAAIYVIIPRISLYVRKQEYIKIQETIVGTAHTVILLIVPAVTGMICLSKNIVWLIGGSNNMEATVPLLILDVSLLFACMACLFINGILLPFGKEKIILVATCISALINIGFNFVLIPKYTYIATAITTFMSELFLCIIGFYYSSKIVKVPFINKLGKSLIGSVLIVVIYFVVKAITDSYIVQIIVIVPASIIAYLSFMVAIKEEIFIDNARKIVSKYRCKK